ncbi:uncharacterized protein FTOL_00427 [Fusarium torulosum]|uniref:C2H2-type domain-containing protein n=1 Tax=Fusarium torulosum TaxID=33205 RepID=A0AAE8LY20_9HYPO|nr:uncharacterized protein FTOL_00427 [Fusarium torulosum]
MADLFAAHQRVADSLSSSSLYQDITDTTELSHSFELVSTTKPDTSDRIPSRKKFISTQKSTKLTLLDNALHEADGESSVEKRPMGDPGEFGHRKKRQTQRRGTDSGDRGEDGKGKGKAPPPDGLRYPPLGPTPRKRFECPFHKYSPDWHYICKGKCMPRISDVTNHLKRRHLLLKVAMGTNTPTQDIVDYCPRCRIEFHGFGAESRLRDHLTQGGRCQEASIEQTGVMLPSEFDELKRKLRSASDEVTKWFIVWRECFLQTAPPSSPYVETTVSQTRTSEPSSVNYSTASDNVGPFAAQDIHTGPLLTMNEAHIDASLQTSAGRQASRPVYNTPVYTPFHDYNSPMPQPLSTLPSSSGNIYWTGPELIGSQAGQDFDALDETYHFMDHGIHTSIGVPDAGNLDLANLVPSGDDRYQDGFHPHLSGNDQGRSQN